VPNNHALSPLFFCLSGATIPTMKLKNSIRSFPDNPGVYIMRDDSGKILYIGKAGSLKQRVRSYFSNTDSRPQVRFLMARVVSIEFTITDTEKEALLLENTLIKQHKPRYNLNLKDDKTYFSLRTDLKEPFPRITIVRKTAQDGARYFGPYSSASAAREVLRQIQRIFPLRHYPWKNCQRRSRPCLYHQMGQCSAPCHGKIAATEYRQLLDGAILFLEGKRDDLSNSFKQKMLDAARMEQYEEAARWRDLIIAINRTLEQQKMVSQGGDSDILGLARAEEQLVLVLLFIRGGNVSGSTILHASGEIDDSGTISGFIRQYYSEERFIPDNLLLPQIPEDRCLLEEFLSERKGKRVHLLQPKAGEKHKLLLLAAKNADAALASRQDNDLRTVRILQELQEKLNLPVLPARIECYDISTLQGRHSVGSGISFTDGSPDKVNYRRYRIKGIEGQDDFAMLKEVFSRRFSPERIKLWGIPDLVMVDGGTGQLNSALAAVEELGLSGRFPLISLAKSRVKGDGKNIYVERTEERVFLPGRTNPVRFRQDSPSIKLLAAIRDEAHRFAITYHRNLRGKTAVHSSLREIPGVGQKLERRLLVKFGSIEGITKESVDTLASVPGVSSKLAEDILNSLQKD